MKKKFAISTIVAMSFCFLFVLFPTQQAQAKSKKYYEYKLKAYPAKILDGRAGDHTYVCIKKKRKKNGERRTVRNYGCFSYTGGKSGGSTRGRWWNKSKSDKNGALCTQRNGDCRIMWGVSGMCHQEANRMLYGGDGGIINVYGYTNGIRTYYRFGRYGYGWSRCKKTCY